MGKGRLKPFGYGTQVGPAENRKGFMIQHKDPTSVGWWSWCLWSFDPSPCLIVHPSITQCIRNHLRSNLYINVYSIFAAMIYHPLYLFGSFQSHLSSSRRWHALKPNGAQELGLNLLEFAAHNQHPSETMVDAGDEICEITFCDNFWGVFNSSMKLRMFIIISRFCEEFVTIFFDKSLP